MKDPADLARVHELIARADVLVQNFRPGVMTRLGLDYETVRAINPGIVYGEITGYGNEGVWVFKPGQDLLLQSISGLVWLNGGADRPPTPFGLAVVDLFTGRAFSTGDSGLFGAAWCHGRRRFGVSQPPGIDT